jgi:hypothetical protein
MTSHLNRVPTAENPTLIRCDSFPLLDHPSFAQYADDSIIKPTLNLAQLLSDPAKLKKLCRAGLPIYQRPEIWFKIVQQAQINPPAEEISLETLKLEIFHRSDKGENNFSLLERHHQIVPDFGSAIKWHEHDIPLSKKRIHWAKILLCCLSHNFPELVYMPFAVDLSCLLLLQGYTEQSCWTMLNRLVRRSTQDSWYFPLGAKNFVAFTHTFEELLRKHVKELVSHMEKLKIDPKFIFSSWVQRFFVSFIPLPAVIRFMDAWLYEGQKIFLRISLALFKMHKKQLKSCENSKIFMQKLTELLRNLTNFDHLMQSAFDLHLSRTNIFTISVEQAEIIANKGVTLPSARQNIQFRLPKFPETESEILKLHDIYALYAALPDNLRLFDPVLLYSSSKHGASFNSLRTNAQKTKLEERSMIIVLRDSAGGTFGAVFMDNLVLNVDKAPVNVDARAFLFTLQPELHIFKHKILRFQEEESLLKREHLLKPLQVKVSPSWLLTAENSFTNLTNYNENTLGNNKFHIDVEEFNNRTAESVAKGAENQGNNNKANNLTTMQAPLSSLFDGLTRARGNSAPVASNSPGDLNALTISHAAPSNHHSSLENLASTEEKEGNSSVGEAYIMRSAVYWGVADAAGWALAVDEELRYGFSKATKVYNNPALSKAANEEGKFLIFTVEVWGFEHPLAHLQQLS